MRNAASKPPCEDIFPDQWDIDKAKKLQLPRRTISILFDRMLPIMSFLSITIPLLGTVLFLFFNVRDWNVLIAAAGIVIFLVIAFIYTYFSEISSKTIEYRNWLINLCREENTLFHVILAIICIFLIAKISIMFSVRIREWIWILFVLPPMIASKHKDSYFYGYVTGGSVLAIIVLEYWNYNFNPSNGLIGWLEPLLVGGIKGCLIVTITAANHYSVRRFILWMERNRILQSTLAKLSMTDLSENEIDVIVDDWIAKDIAQSLGFDRALIFRHEPFDDSLHVIASYGYEIEKEKEIILKDGKGIAGQVMLTRMPHLAKKIRGGSGCPHFYTLLGDDKTKCELAVPILLRGEKLGVLNVQSDIEDSITKEDVQLVSSLANAIALRLYQQSDILEKIEKEEQLLTLEEASSMLRRRRDWKVQFKAFWELLNKHLGVDLVCLYRLAPGTGYPLLPPHIEGDFIKPNFMENKSIAQDSIVFQLMREWEPAYFEDCRNNPILAIAREPYKEFQVGKSDRFVLREKIRSSAFIPLGIVDEQVGVLWLNYRNQRNFSDRYKLQVQVLANLFSIHLLVEQQRQMRISPLFLGEHDLHAEFGLKYITLLNRLRSINIGDDIGEVIKSIEKDLEEMMVNATFLTSYGLGELEDKKDIKRRFYDWANALEIATSNDSKINLNIDSNIFFSGKAAVQAIYSIVTEAMLNSVQHGKARNINVEVKKEDTRLRIQVEDDGIGFNIKEKLEEHEAMKKVGKMSKRGIFTRHDSLEEIFGAKKPIIDSEPGKRTIFTTGIPTISEFTSEENDE